MNNCFDIELVLSKLREKRKLFVSEKDLQLEMAWIIKEEYPKSKVRLEYCPSFDPNMHIDILVIINNKWIPIELKYKTRKCKIKVDGEEFNLKNHGAKDINCYAYLKDIQRIEKVRNSVSNFIMGYTVFITNDLTYTKSPIKENCIYKAFSIHEGVIKKGKMCWTKGASEGTKKGCEDPITLEDSYKMNWSDYSTIDNTNTGNFVYLINKIK